MKNIPIGEVLKEYGYITDDQLQEALAAQKQDRSKRLGAILIALGYVTEQQLMDALGKRLNLKILTLETFHVDGQAVEKLPKQIALKYTAIAVSQESGRLLVAINDPLDFYAVEDIRLIANMPVDICIASKQSILAAIDFYYSEIDARVAASKANIAADEEVADLAAQIEVREDDQTPVVRLLNSLLVKGYNAGASDIHIEPFEEKLSVRMRIDGMLIDYITLAPNLHPSLLARTKILSGLNIAEKRMPQDGHFKATIEGIEMNIRVSVIPTIYGEKAVLRFLTTNVTIDHEGQFGMDEDHYRKVIEMLQNPHGIIYLTGPTGSGKTTTLYMALAYLAKKQVNISTIEDPVERNLVRVNQMQVNNAAGLTFESGLRALLRQDPDIIMVGETRDNETASISVRAAITGHLVLSTLHTNDAISTIVRLHDMGVEPYLLANSLAGIVAQRLVRKICPNCKKAYTPDAQERLLCGDVDTLYRGEGCHMCNNTGYRGRIAIHEVVAVDREIRTMIARRDPIEAIYRYAAQTLRYRTLRDRMNELVQQGVTTTEELLKLTYTVD